ncbi:TPA: dihydroorotate dehydrogenase electron transfer subunit [Candidatus Micrarchaeota archaeon]|nr:dihydroorotate dehydrogenase electron transfer subunit [Candidatus Micrarchaeota archaeon]HIH30213.1 dihydroorotate dehydrogenase electron transfer subunit [Candidatus Micrarchaeota archaeon]
MILMLPQVATVAKAEKENSTVTTLTLNISLPRAIPGQFVMAWLPGFDEKPLSLAGASPVKISVGERGPFSSRLCGLKKGGKLWVRGPYGRGFELEGKKILLVGGGYGFAPLRFLADQARKKKITATAICGARSKSLLMAPASCKTLFTTDDGSAGIKGNVLAAMEGLFAREKFDTVYTCGPERMMGSVARLAKKKKADCQLLLERYMKCGIGVCGHCACGDRLVCFDGPRFGYEMLSNPEFERVWRDKAGHKVPI